MEQPKCINHTERAEYTYESEEQRTNHIKVMITHGWSVGSRTHRMKDTAHIMTATDEDYEWYGEFYRSRME